MSTGSGLLSRQRTQRPHLVQPGGGLSGEVFDLRRDLENELSAMAAILVEEFTNPAAPGAADLAAAAAVSEDPVVVTSFLAGGLAKLAAFPRNITFTTAGSTPADAPATAVITGTYRGMPQTETVNLAQTATIATGVKPFSTVESIAFAAGDGTDATVSIGIGSGLGVGRKPMARAGLTAPVREIAAGAAVTTGTLTTEGLYTPSAAPNGTNDYAIYYEADMSAP